VDYTLYGRVENELLRLDYIIENIVYDDSVNFSILCDNEKEDDLRNLLINTTSAKITIENIGEEYYSVKEGELIK